MNTATLSEIFKAGGPVLILLLLISVFSIALILEKWFSFRRTEERHNALKIRLELFFKNSDFKQLKDYCALNVFPSSALVLSLLRSTLSRNEKREYSARVIDKYITDISGRLSALATIGSVTPFIGLFGTVLGVMRAFKDLSLYAGAGPSVVAMGIAEALINTAAGLFVAIPAVIFYNYFANKANELSADLNWISEQIISAAPDVPNCSIEAAKH